jgi:ornithine cyclodeaminase
MRVISGADIASSLDFPSLIGALKDAFRADITVPPRHHVAVPHPDAEATLLLMPAWSGTGRDSFIGIKVIAIFPANVACGVPSLTGSYLLLSGDTGLPLALLDGGALTCWRTAAASALAAKYLSRAAASRHLIVGAGALAPYFARAFRAVRSIRETLIWNRTAARAEAVASELRAEGHAALAVRDLDAATRSVDIVSCITGAEAPLVHGASLKPGTHLDLVGGFKPQMREVDDEAVVRARVFVDTRKAAEEAGDLRGPIERGLLRSDDIRADLFALCRGLAPGRGTDEEITLFKSVGTAVEDLAAAMLVWRRLGGK